MARFKVFFLLLLYIAHVSSEDRTISLDKLKLEKSVPYIKEQPGFFSKLKNWFFPSDSLPAEGHHSAPTYLPPYQSQSQSDCHPCNKAPWIPILSNHGHKNVISFVPPSSHLEDLRPPPSTYGAPSYHYGPPLNFGPPQQQYGPPKEQYGPPKEQYGPPKEQYGPPKEQYGPPKQQYGPPKQQYGPPPALYEPYRPPPSPSSNYGPPKLQYGPPKLQYEPPKLQYGPPKLQHGPPKLQYGAPPNPFSGPQQHDVDLTPPPAPHYKPPNQRPPHFQRPQKLYPLQNLIPPPVTHLQPVAQNYVPIDMRPPPISGEFYLSPPPPPPSDSYGSPVAAANSDYQIREEYVPIPLPNLSPVPMAPIHQPSDFHGYDNVPQSGVNYEVKANNVQVVPSVTVADYLASVEHPINVVQSPLVEVSVNQETEKLSENPIVVEDTHTAASTLNLTFQDSNHGYRVENETFTPPSMDYSKWVPSWSAVPSPTTWLKPVSTEKPKQIQIIVPYVNKNTFGRMVPSEPYTTLVPMYTPPTTKEEEWSKFVESPKVNMTTQVYNINDLLKDTNYKQPDEEKPFDVISLQNNIDDWTQQAYSKIETIKLVPAKSIPDDFIESTTIFDHEQAGSNNKETKVDDIQSNLILGTEKETTDVTTEQTWDKVTVTVSPQTKEKVYVVTPAPLILNSSTPKTAWSHPPQVPTPKFLVRVDPQGKDGRNRLENSGPLTVVYSEWPHLINNLETTTPRTGTSYHPLLGLMDLSKYTPPPNATVETIDGHSRVMTVVTPVPDKSKTT